MARILSNESSLSRQRAKLGRESRVLRVLLWVEGGAAALMLLIGSALAWMGKGSGLLWGGFALGFIAVSHYFKTRQNARDEQYMNAGLRGENEVAKLLNENLSDDYYLYHDIVIRSGFNSAQIDHLVVCAKGMFVIETKNWRGRLVGDERDRKWLQYKAPDQPARPLANPILQNRRHVALLEKYLRTGGVSEVPLIPMLVFTGRNTTLDIKNQKSLLLWPREAVDYILQFKQDHPLPTGVVDKVLNRLQRCV